MGNRYVIVGNCIYHTKSPVIPKDPIDDLWHIYTQKKHKLSSPFLHTKKHKLSFLFLSTATKKKLQSTFCHSRHSQLFFCQTFLSFSYRLSSKPLSFFFISVLANYIHMNLPVNAIFRLPLPRSGDSQGQETFLAPSLDIYVTMFFYLKKLYYKI